MADAQTPFLSLVKPGVGDPAGEDKWGDKLNANFDKIDEFAAGQGVLTEAPTDGKPYVRQSATWSEALDKGTQAAKDSAQDAAIGSLSTQVGAIAWPVPGTPSTFPPTLPIAQSGVTNLVSDLALKAPLASPIFSGTPVAPTPAAGDNSTLLATTAFIAMAMAGLPIGDLNCGTFPYNPVVPPTPPSPSSYPSASNTGTSGTLTVDSRTGVITTTANGQVFQNLNFTGSGTQLNIRHNNCVVRNCRIPAGSNAYCIDAEFAQNVLIEDCDLIATPGVSASVVWMQSGTIQRCDISGADNGIYFRGSTLGVTIKDNYIHGLGGGPEAHVDGIQTDQCGPGPSLIQHNTIEAFDTSHVFLQCTSNDVTNVKVLDNQMLKHPTYGPPGYNVYVNGWGTRPGGAAATITNVEIANNFGDRGQYGDIDVAGNTSGISIHDNTLGLTPEPPPSTTGTTIFGGAAPSGGSLQQDNNQFTIGARIEPLVNGNINAILWYRASTLAGADGKVAVYNAATGAKLAEAAFTGISGAGWKRVPLSAPLAVTTANAYVIAVWLKLGSDSHTYYWAQSNKFATAGVTDPLGKVTMPPSDGTTVRGSVRKNNLFTYTGPTDIAFPDQVFNASGYYVDVDYS